MKECMYAVLEDITYYSGDVQHPMGFELRVAAILDNDGDEKEYIGTLEECKYWLDRLNSANTYLSQGQASKHYRIAKILDDAVDFQVWLDNVDWNGCPDENGSNLELCDADVQWALKRAYKEDGEILVPRNNTHDLLLVDLSPIN